MLEVEGHEPPVRGLNQRAADRGPGIRSRETPGHATVPPSDAAQARESAGAAAILRQ